MKKAIIIFIFLLLGLTSCSRDKEVQPDSEEYVTNVPTEPGNKEITLTPVATPVQKENSKEGKRVIDAPDLNNSSNLTNTPEDKSKSLPTVSTAQVDLKSYEGEWYAEDYGVHPDSIFGEYSGCYISLKVSGNKAGGSIYIECVSDPPFIRIADIDTDWILDGDIGKFTFDNDGWENKGTGTITFLEKSVVINIDMTYYADSMWDIFIGEKSFYKDMKYSASDDTGIIADDPGSLNSWVGYYDFYEYCPPDENMIYSILIYREEDNYFAEISINGFQTMMNLQATVSGDEDYIDLIFNKYLPDNEFEPFEKGDILLSFSRDNSDILTYWGEIQPLLYKESVSGSICFTPSY